MRSWPNKPTRSHQFRTKNHTFFASSNASLVGCAPAPETSGAHNPSAQNRATVTVNHCPAYPLFYAWLHTQNSGSKALHIPVDPLTEVVRAVRPQLRWKRSWPRNPELLYGLFGELVGNLWETCPAGGRLEAIADRSLKKSSRMV